MMPSKFLPITLFFVFSMACANSGDQPDGTDASRSQSPAPLPVPVTKDSADASFDSAGVIRFSLAQDELAASLQAYIVGKAATHQAAREATTGNSFQIRNLQPGLYDMILTATEPATTASSQPTMLGARINGLKLTTDGQLKLSPIRLAATHTISGKIHGLDGPLADSDVRLVGTNYVATTDSSGRYTIPGVPQGSHRFQANKNGYHQGRIELLRLEADATNPSNFHQIPDLTLSETTADGPGVLSPNDDQNPADQLTVLFVMLAPETANLMRVGEQVDLENAAWQPLQTSLRYTFNNPGAKTLYVQFSKDRSQRSAIFQSNVLIQLP